MDAAARSVTVRQVFDRLSEKDETLFACLNIAGYISELGRLNLLRARSAPTDSRYFFFIFNVTYISRMSVGLVRDV